MQDTDQLLTIARVAEIAGVKSDTARSWVRTKKLPATVTATGRYRVRASDLDTFLSGGPEPGTLPAPEASPKAQTRKKKPAKPKTRKRRSKPG